VGRPLKLKGFGKTTSKYVHEFSTFTTYMQGLVSYFADKKLLSVTRLFEIRVALNPKYHGIVTDNSAAFLNKIL